MESPLNQSFPTLEDSAAQLFNCSFLDKEELDKLERAVQSKQKDSRKRARVDSSNTSPAASDDRSTAPNTPRMDRDFGSETSAEVRVAASVSVVAALVQDVVQEAVKNKWRVTVSMEFNGSDETVTIIRISPPHESKH